MKGRYIVVVVLASLLIISGIIGLVWNKAPFNTPSLTEKGISLPATPGVSIGDYPYL
ncbi:hypothetical protein ES703_100679 [subsurface metagenome]